MQTVGTKQSRVQRDAGGSGAVKVEKMENGEENRRRYPSIPGSVLSQAATGGIGVDDFIVKLLHYAPYNGLKVQLGMLLVKVTVKLNSKSPEFLSDYLKPRTVDPQDPWTDDVLESLLCSPICEVPTKIMLKTKYDSGKKWLGWVQGQVALAAAPEPHVEYSANQ